MPITANFTVSQGTDNSRFTVTDTTTYDVGEPVGSMVSRTITFYKSDGTVLGTQQFDGSQLTMEVEDLTKDWALRGVFTIVPPSVVAGSTYTRVVTFVNTGYSMTGFFQRNIKMKNNPRLENNRDYTTDTYKILMEVEAAKAAANASDIVSSQLCLDRIKKILDVNALPY